MGARVLVAAVCALGAAAGGTAWGAPTLDGSPTSSVTTYLLNGTALPVTPVAAQWTNVRPGCAGSLQASGPAVSGTTTVVVGDFLSEAFRPRGGEVIDITGEQGGRRQLQPSPESLALSMRLRDIGHTWSHWFTLDLTADPPPLRPASLFYVDASGAGFGFAEAPPRPGHRLPLQQVQVRVRDTITSTGVIKDGFDVRFGC